jgi:hypothetical protein
LRPASKALATGFSMAEQFELRKRKLELLNAHAIGPCCGLEFKCKPQTTTSCMDQAMSFTMINPGGNFLHLLNHTK